MILWHSDPVHNANVWKGSAVNYHYRWIERRPSEMSISIHTGYHEIACNDVAHAQPANMIAIHPMKSIASILVTLWFATAVCPQDRASSSSPSKELDPRMHWAFQTPRRPAVPIVAWQSGQSNDYVRNPIDAFIANHHQQKGLIPFGQAPAHILVRRATLDMTGLVPTPAELQDYLKDESVLAWDRVVNRLLDDPAYGERWGRHWMDIWRYSDWYGRRQVNDVRNSYPHIWRWRDWIIKSLNKDTAYDEMLRMMLAADELDPENDDNIVALGFIVRNWFSLNYDQWMKDQVEHTGKAFLGLRLNCAHCHDHKYDPITQEEYFRFRAFFEPLELRHDRVPGGPILTKYQRYKPGSGGSLSPIKAGLARIFDDNLNAHTYMYRLGDSRDRFDRDPVAPGTPAILGGSPFQIEPVKLPTRAWYPGLKEFAIREEIAKRELAVRDAVAHLEKARAALKEKEQSLLAAIKVADDKLSHVKQQLASRQRLSNALAGEQSLVLEAGTGRSVLANHLVGVKTIDDQTRIRCLIKLQTNVYAAIGLTLDHETGRTGGYMAFRNGEIISYRAAKQHAEFTAGRYDFMQGQNTFEVTFDLEPSRDRCLLSVVALAENSESDACPRESSRTVLVDNIPVALHGWNIATDPKNILSIDARAGTVAVFDNFEIGSRGHNPTIRIDFEPPEFTDGDNPKGHQGWIDSKWTVAPGSSHVSRLVDVPPELKQAELENRVVRRALDATKLAVIAAEKTLSGARSGFAALRARIQSERRRYLLKDAVNDLQQLIQSTSAVEHTAQLELAEAAFLTARAGLARVEAMPLDNAKRAQMVTDATKLVSQTSKVVHSKKVMIAKTDNQATYTPLSPTYPKESTGRRSALARWLTDKKNPLPARVAVNHIWMRHFGHPLVASVYDFGNSGAQPTHPKLLDWLAVELIESGWSMKHIHRLILTSQTFRMSSRPGIVERNRMTEENLTSAVEPGHAVDSENKFLWRFQQRRLEAELIRDCILHVSGRLDRTLGGKEIDPKHESESLRRSMYFSVYPEAGGTMKFLEQFDAANPAECYRRTESIVPQQALAMNNSDIVQNESRRTADRLIHAVGPSKDRTTHLVQSAFLICLARQCTEQEKRLAVEFLRHQMSLYGDTAPSDPERRALASLVRVLFSHHDFITIQ